MAKLKYTLSKLSMNLLNELLREGRKMPLLCPPQVRRWYTWGDAVLIFKNMFILK